MNLVYIKNSSQKCMEILTDVYNAMNTFQLTGYAQQKTNTNCMEALQQVYNQLKEINKESDEALKESEDKDKE